MTSTAEANTDLVTAVHSVLQAHREPLTLSKVRAALPGAFKDVGLEELDAVVERQVSANVLYQYPRYRSQHDRFWDRPMPVHIGNLLRDVLAAGPLPWSDLRRKLPGYVRLEQAGSVLQELLAQGTLYRHPRLGRGGERYGTSPPDPRHFLRAELDNMFGKLEALGFTRATLRTGALELLHEDEWGESGEPGGVSPRSHESAAETN